MCVPLFKKKKGFRGEERADCRPSQQKEDEKVLMYSLGSRPKPFITAPNLYMHEAWILVQKPYVQPSRQLKPSNWSWRDTKQESERYLENATAAGEEECNLESDTRGCFQSAGENAISLMHCIHALISIHVNYLHANFSPLTFPNLTCSPKRRRDARSRHEKLPRPRGR